MSGDWSGDPAAVWQERLVKARVEHRCAACGDRIAPGATYTRHVRINEVGDTPEVWKRCARCERLYRFLDDAARVGDAPDPGLDCGHTYEEINGCAPPPEIAALAFALPGEVGRDDADV